MTGREVLLEMDNKKFLWYKLEKAALKHAKISGGLDYFESFVSLGTLVPLYGGGNENTEVQSNRREVRQVSECIFYLIFRLYCFFSRAIKT